MAQRTEALYNGEIIGIESIFTVIDGKQINIPDKLKSLRAKSRADQLFCPCGCGTNLILVAGDKNLREQHFREKNSDENPGCKYKAEGKRSIYSKIVLKCWLEDKLKTDDIEARVPICDVLDTDRKYEFSFLIKSRRLAISYCRGRENLSEEKLSLIEKYKNNNRIIYIVDSTNAGSDGQFPEGLMKVQDRQGYDLLLNIDGYDYYKATLRACFSDRNLNGIWQEVEFANDRLCAFDIDDIFGVICPDGRPLFEWYSKKKAEFQAKIEAERKRKAEEEARRIREEERQRLEAERRAEEYRRWMEKEERIRKQREEEERLAKEERERKLKEAMERKALEKEKEREQFELHKDDLFQQQERPIYSPDGFRAYMCSSCGKVGPDEEFSMRGGVNRLNLGICKECMRKQDNTPAGPKENSDKKNERPRWVGVNVCPECGGNLVERRGQYGKFMGCSNYPRCRYIKR